jgi:hypothetical protein
VTEAVAVLGDIEGEDENREELVHVVVLTYDDVYPNSVV